MANHFSKPAQIAVAVTATLSAWAQAQEVRELEVTHATAQTENSYKVDESANRKYPQPLLDTAKTITTISQPLMRDRNVDSLRDALRNVSGISMAAGEGGTPSGDSMSIRGFSARTDIFINGIRDISGYSRDMFNIESVEVAKGPGSAVSGRGSTGGSISLQLKTAKLDDFVEASARVGTESDYRTTVDANKTLGDNSALRVNLLADDGDVAGRDHVENQTFAGAISFATGLNTNSRFSVNADLQKQDNVPDYGIPWVPATGDIVDELADYAGEAPPVDFDNFYGNLYRDFEEIDAKSLTASYEYDLSDSTMLRANARIGSVARKGIVTAPRFYKIAESTDVRMSDEKTRDTKDSLAAVQFDLIGEYQLGATTHNLVTGVEWASEDFKRWNYVALVADNLNDDPGLNDLYNPDPYMEFTGEYGRDGTSIKAESTNKAVYIFDSVTFTEQWEATVGLRYDDFSVDYQNSYTDPSSIVSSKDSMLSWNLGLVFKPAANGSVYFGAGNSLNPSAEGLTVSSNYNTLEPEETTSYEIGTKWSLMDDALSLNAAIFRTNKDKVRTRDIDGNYEIGGEHQVEGLELSAAGQINKNWLVTASYTYQDSEVLKEGGYASSAITVGNELPRTPKNSWSLWTKYELSDQLAAGFGAQYMGKVYNSSNPESRRVADDYLLFDLMVSYQFDDKLSLQLNGENLTDEDYIDQVGGGHFIPGEGRSFTLSARYAF